jgi:hypothetical protein
VQTLLPKVVTFIDEFHSGKAADLSDEGPSPVKPVVKDHGASAAASAATEAAGARATAVKATASTAKAPRGSSGRTIKMQETFYASAHL